MTSEQRQARAIFKASETRAHVLKVVGRPGFYQVRSASNPDDRHVLNVHNGVVVCSCPAGEHGFPCWHVAKLESRLIREAVAAQRKEAKPAPVSISSAAKARELLYA